MVGFLKNVIIRQGEDYYGMWLILRLKEQGKFAWAFALHAYPLLLVGPK